MIDEPCSVCVAAHNEEATLPRLLTDLTRRPPGLVGEILVCANGCTDGTTDIVEEFAARDPRIRLIGSRVGKPNAWNRLVEHAQYDTVVFLDADVSLERDAILELVKGFRPGIVIAAGLDRPRIGLDPRQWLAAYLLRPRLDKYLNGRIYAIRRSVLLRRMEAKIGRRTMPEDLLQEDFWLQTLLEPQELVVVSQARARFESPLLREYPQIKARLRLGAHQVQRQFPVLYDQWRRTRRSTNSTVAMKLRAAWKKGGFKLVASRTLDVVTRRLAMKLWGAEIERLYAEMLEHFEAAGGQSVLRGPGRIESTKRVAELR